MQPRLLMATALVGLASASLGGGVYAFFNDQGESTGNLFAAGTVDLKLEGQDNLVGTIGGPNMRPGDEFNADIKLSNAGLLPGTAFDLDVRVDAYVDAGPDGIGNVASFLRVDSLQYGGSPLSLPDVNGNGYADLDDWNQDNSATRDLADPGPETHLAMTIVFDEAAGNELQGDFTKVDFRFYLAQTLSEDDQEP